MTYATETASIQRTPITLVKIILDFCALTYGVGACTATGSAGEECYNTFKQCQDQVNFDKDTKEYLFSDYDGPYVPDARPYLMDIDWMPTEIRPGKLTIKGRVVMTFADDTDSSYGIDPYVDNRATKDVQSFWKVLLARNPNYKGRRVEVYQGYDGLAVGDFELRWAGNLEAITLGNGQVKIEIIDELNDLSKVDVPPKVDVKLVTDITAGATTITLSTSDDIPATGYLMWKSDVDGDQFEVVSYTSINTSTNQISGVTRGALGTVSAAASSGTKVTVCAYYAPANPFDIMQAMLTDTDTDSPPGAGIPSARVDTTTWATEKGFPGDEPDFSALITKSTKLDKLLFEVAKLCDCSIFVNESQKITIRRNNVPNKPGRASFELSDNNSIIDKSASVDLGEELRRTRTTIYWDKLPTAKDDDKPESYNAIELVVDVDAEGPNEYNTIDEEVIWCRWLRRSWGAYLQEETVARFVTNLAARILVNRRDSHAAVSFQVELKDEGVKCGDYVKLSTDELLLPDGSTLDNKLFSVFKRDPKNNTVKLSVVHIRESKIGIIAPDATPVFTSTTDAQKEYGFISNNSGEMSDGTDAYRIY